MSNNSSKVQSGLRGVLDTATFGISPKIASLADAIKQKENATFAERYQENLKNRREQYHTAAEENPLSYMGGSLAGAFASPIKGGKGVSLGQRAKRGGVLGGLYGFGNSDSGEAFVPEFENAVDAAYGGAIGAAAEMVLPPIFRGAGYIANKLTPEFVKEGASKLGSKIANTFVGKEASQTALSPFKGQNLSQEQNEISNLSRHAPFAEKGENAAPAISKIQEQHKLAKEAAQAPYEVIKKEVGFLDIKDVKQFIPKMREGMAAEMIASPSHPMTYGYMKTFEKLLTKEAPQNAIGVDLKLLEKWRSRVGEAIRDHKTPRSERTGLIALRKGYDDFINHNIEKALLEGNPGLLKEFEAAREGYTKYMKQYTADHKDEYGKKFIEDIINNGSSREPYSNEMIANKIFGTNKLGFKPQSINIINELKSHLGADSPEFHGLRLEGMKKVLSPLLNNPENKLAAFEKYSANLKEQMPVLKELLAPNVIKELEYIAKEGSQHFKKSAIPIKETIGKLPTAGLVMKLFSNIKDAKTPIEEIYGSANKSASVPSAASRSITQALMTPEVQPEKDIAQPETAIETPPTIKAPEDYRAFMDRMTPEQKEELRMLQQSMHPVQQ